MKEKEQKNIHNEPCVEELEDAEINDNLNEEILKLNEVLKNAQNEITQQKENFLRIAAEYDNYRKRTERDKIGIYQDATSKVILEILPIIDSLNIAVNSDKGSNDDYKKGFELIYRQLNSALKKLSVECFGEVGEVFDPEIHNAVAHADSDDVEENIITEVFQLGYKVEDKIIRHAMVKVAN